MLEESILLFEKGKYAEAIELLIAFTARRKLRQYKNELTIIRTSLHAIEKHIENNSIDEEFAYRKIDNIRQELMLTIKKIEQFCTGTNIKNNINNSQPDYLKIKISGYEINADLDEEQISQIFKESLFNPRKKIKKRIKSIFLKPEFEGSEDDDFGIVITHLKKMAAFDLKSVCNTLINSVSSRSNDDFLLLFSRIIDLERQFNLGILNHQDYLENKPKLLNAMFHFLGNLNPDEIDTKIIKMDIFSKP